MALAACVPSFDVDLSRVDVPRILAVSAAPAEAEPGASVILTALYADSGGTVKTAPLSWSLCTARRPLAELGPVSRACLEGQADTGVILGDGLTVNATVPDDVCGRFGPDPPPATAGQPTGRPVDPDVTGGYYQPILVQPPDGEHALLLLRVHCGVAGATQGQAAEFRRRYMANTAPEIVTISRDMTGDDIGDSLTVGARDTVDLRVRWAPCPDQPLCGDGLCTLDEDPLGCTEDCTTPRGCAGAESYLRFDPVALELTTRHEAMRVAWYATAGTFTTTNTGRASGDLTPTSDNTWTAPAEPEAVTLWIVMRDDRGGTSWRSISIDVQ